MSFADCLSDDILGLPPNFNTALAKRCSNSLNRREVKKRVEMVFAIPFPDISPDLFSIDLWGFKFALRWYALAYIAGFVLAWYYLMYLCRRPHLWPGAQPPYRPKDLEDLLIWMVLGVILGGRFGYVFFYAPQVLITDPIEVFRIWNGGMSFHGGFLGVIISAWIFCKIRGLNPLSAGDGIAIAATFGIGLGRVANFVNGELWGRPTDMPWGVVFPNEAAQDCFPKLVELCARHPSQLYEAALEGVVLFLFLAWLIFRRSALQKPGQIIAWFLIGYGAMRTFVEGFRQGDSQFVSLTNPNGHILRLGDNIESLGLTMGQLLSLPMVILGLLLLFWVRMRQMPRAR